MNLNYELNIYEDLVRELKENDASVKDVIVGLHGVYVESKSSGISLRYGGRDHSTIRGVTNLTEKKALELSEYLKSWNFSEASIGLAALNSIIEPEGEQLNAFDFVDKRINQDDDIGVIGHFPWVERTETDAKVHVLERNPGGTDYPDTAAEYILPKCDMVLVTGSSLVNKTLPRILELSEDAYTIVLGPSTPFSSVLFDYGVDAIAGARTINHEGLRKGIKEGSKICNLHENLEFLMKVND